MARNTKINIVKAAWQLFYKKGYEQTTIDDIVEISQTSKGSFYHYFKAKEELLSGIAYLFDSKYEELEDIVNKMNNPIEKLVYLNKELFFLIENTVPVNLLSQVFAKHLINKGERVMYEQDRMYYRMIRQIAKEGKEKDIFRDDLSANDITIAYSIFERGLIYDWCLCDGNYSFCKYAQTMLPLFLKGLCK